MAAEMVTMYDQQEMGRSAVGQAQDNIMRATFAFIEADDGSMSDAQRSSVRARVIALGKSSTSLERKLLLITRDADLEDLRRSTAASWEQSVWLATSMSPPGSAGARLYGELQALRADAVQAMNDANRIVSELRRESSIVSMASRRFLLGHQRKARVRLSHRGA